MLQRLRSLRESGRDQQLPAASRSRFDELLPIALRLAGEQGKPDETLSRLLNFLESICRRASYLALLAEYPQALELVTRLAGASPWLAGYLSQHPILLDELLDTRNLYAAPDFSALRADLRQRLQEADGDVERQMDAMRHFKHAQTFRFAAQDLAGVLPLETLSDHLSDLADLILRHVLALCWKGLRTRHRDDPRFAIIAYGKLGGRELGYASDLDLIFLYEDDAPDAGVIYARLVQRINSLLSSYTASGRLYEVDLRLRPNGESGLLVSNIGTWVQMTATSLVVYERGYLTAPEIFRFGVLMTLTSLYLGLHMGESAAEVGVLVAAGRAAARGPSSRPWLRPGRFSSTNAGPGCPA